MFSKKVRINIQGSNNISVGTALVLLSIDELISDYGYGSVYGYQIMSHLKEKFNWEVKSGTVYPILKKLTVERYLRKEITVKHDSKTHQVNYFLNNKGKKIIEEIKLIDSNKLDSLHHTDSFGKEAINTNNNTFKIENCANEYFSPFLLDYDNKISKALTNVSISSEKDIDIVETQIQKSLDELELCKKLLHNELDKIKIIKDSKK